MDYGNKMSKHYFFFLAILVILSGCGCCKSPTKADISRQNANPDAAISQTINSVNRGIADRTPQYSR